MLSTVLSSECITQYRPIVIQYFVTQVEARSTIRFVHSIRLLFHPETHFLPSTFTKLKKPTSDRDSLLSFSLPP